MATPSDIKKIIKEIVGAYPNLPISGVVKSIQGDSCTVTLKAGFEVSDVKLKATIGNTDFILLTPKVGSTVMMLSHTGRTDNLTVIKVDQVAKMEYMQNGLNILADSEDGKVRIKNDQVSFIDIWRDLKSLIAGLKVSTPNGPSGVPLPNTQTALTSLETKFNKLLK